MFGKKTVQLLYTAGSLVMGASVVPGASAGLVLETYASGQATPTVLGGYDVLGGYEMTDFASTTKIDCSTKADCRAISVALPDPLVGTVDFYDYYGNPLEMNRATAETTWWWNNPEKTDNDIYTTHVNWVELVLPSDTRAFSFNVGANFNGWGWMEGYDGDGKKIKETFKLGTDNTPGFGFYADNSDGGCGSITSIVIDPSQWGVGNFSINQGKCTASVPEPGVLGLLGIGMLGLGVARSRYTD